MNPGLERLHDTQSMNRDLVWKQTVNNDLKRERETKREVEAKLVDALFCLPVPFHCNILSKKLVQMELKFKSLTVTNVSNSVLKKQRLE